MAKLTVAFVRDIMNQQLAGGISFSRMVELMNEEHKRSEELKSSNVFTRHECIFNYCPNPESCKVECQNPVPFNMGHLK
jgi:hypothetical protein